MTAILDEFSFNISACSLLTQVQLVLSHTASDYILLISGGALPISDQLTLIVCWSARPIAASRNAPNNHADRLINKGDLIFAVAF
jgi:hypothetical protein